MSVESITAPRLTEATAPELQLDVYFDGASLEDMEQAVREGTVRGFTTNPTLAAKAGVRNYREFAREALARVEGMPISFEVLADDLEGIRREAREIGGWGSNVFVKVPVCTTAGVSTAGVVADLAADGFHVNVTAMMTLRQVREVAAILPAGAEAIASVFAGRIADTGIDPCPVMAAAAEACRAAPGLRLLWASPREVLNVYQADACGVDIIVLTADLLAKLALRGKDLEAFSRETVAMFYEDGRRAGYAL